MNSKINEISRMSTEKDMHPAQPPSKEQIHIFYQGQSKYKRAPSNGHAFYDPTQGGLTKRWVAPRD
jgi:hypothetical protein